MFESHITELMSKLLQHSNLTFFVQFGVVSQIKNMHTHSIMRPKIMFQCFVKTIIDLKIKCPVHQEDSYMPTYHIQLNHDCVIQGWLDL